MTSVPCWGYRAFVGEGIELVSVNIGAREVIDVWPEKVIESGIRKRPIAGATIDVGVLGLAGDQQADTRRIRGAQVHGGRGKAIYAYPSEHFDAWRTALGQEFVPGAFGENLTIAGRAEEAACIGDVWRWGEARLQITEPRGPCYKLDIHRGDARTGKIMNETGHTGWYLRVLGAGPAPTDGPIEVEVHHPARVSVLDVHRTLRAGDAAALQELLHLEPLGTDLKTMIRNRLGRRAAAQTRR